MHQKIAHYTGIETVAKSDFHFIIVIPGAETYYVIAEQSCCQLIEQFKSLGLSVLKRVHSQVENADSQKTRELYEQLKPAKVWVKAGSSCKTDASYHEH